MDNFDLNINNYTIKELQELLTLGFNYDEGEIAYNKDKICKKVMNDTSLPFDMKVKLGEFFEGISKMLSKLVVSSMKTANNDNVENFGELKNDMILNTNNLIIADPFAAHNINVDKNKIPGTNVDKYGTTRGVINPLLVNTILKGVNIDSRFRENYYTTKSTDLHINLPFRLENVISYRIVGITLPLTFYNISQAYGNNIILIKLYSSAINPNPYPFPAGIIFKLILPDGCYNSLQNDSVNDSGIETVINNYLANSPDSPNNTAPFSTAGTLLNLKYTIDRTSGRSIFAQEAIPGGTVAYFFEIITNVEYVINLNTYEISFDKNLMLRLGWILGFRAAKYFSSNGAASSGASLPPLPTDYGSIISEGICFTKFPLYGYLSIDDFNKNANDYFVSVFANSISVPNIISRVNFTQFFQLIGAFQAAQGEATSNAINREKRFFGPVTIQKLRITLYDDLGRVLDLNNMDWALELAFECVYSM